MTGMPEDNESVRLALESYTAQTVPALGIDSYAKVIYEANRSAGL